MKPLSEKELSKLFTKLKRKDNMVLYTDTVSGEQTHRDDLWAISTKEIESLMNEVIQDRKTWGEHVIGEDEFEEYKMSAFLSMLAESNNTLRAKQRQRNQGEKD